MKLIKAIKINILIGLMIINSSSAYARLIFQEDDFHDINSEGLMINFDDGGDEDVILQFGNDGTDATITFDDGTGNTSFATSGGSFSFSDDNIVTTGSITANNFTIGSTNLTESTAANDSGAFLIGLYDELDNTNATNLQDALDDLDALIGSNDENTEPLYFEPEYPNTVIFQDGSNNKGKLIAEYDNTNRKHYYRWNTQQSSDQDIDIRFRYQLPEDFKATGDLTIQLRTNTTTAGDNSLATTIRNDTDDQTCHSDPATTSTTNDTWTTITLSASEINTGCTAGSTLAAGDTIEIQLKLLSDSVSHYVDIGVIEMLYTN